jgi:hypothetical protein
MYVRVYFYFSPLLLLFRLWLTSITSAHLVFVILYYNYNNIFIRNYHKMCLSLLPDLSLHTNNNYTYIIIYCYCEIPGKDFCY